MFQAIHVYDMDGVLVDTSHRYRNKPDGSIDLDYWFENRTAEKIAQDKILKHAIYYVNDCIDPRVYTVLCTARVEHQLDIDFIMQELGQPDMLIMRPVGNMEEDSVLKFRQLQRLFNLKQFRHLPRSLWEDNPKNIDALRPLFSAGHCFYVPSHITGK